MKKKDIGSIRHDIGKKIFCDVSVLEKRYENLYGRGTGADKAVKAKKDILKKYIAVIMVFGIVTMFAVAYVSGEKEASELKTDGKGTYIIRPSKGQRSKKLDLRMTVDTNEGKVVKDIQILFDPKKSEEVKNSKNNTGSEKETYAKKMERDVKSAVRMINSDTTKDVVYLPSELAGGEKVRWEKYKASDLPLIIAALIVTISLLVKNRYSGLEKEERMAKESILKELPEFINKMILLINAGVVINTAFITIMNEREKMQMYDKNYFYGQMKNIYIKVTRARGSLNSELKSFAKRSGVRELMRFSNIIDDNIEKGVGLVEKLKRESEILWFARKKQSEEKGRAAETKMTFPLVILLLVLVIITVAPAMIEL